MPESPRYLQLRQELDHLKSTLLPAKFDPLGEYAEGDITKTVAYRVLAHAEIESFIEDRVWETALRAVRAWRNSRVASAVLVSLLLFSGRQFEEPPKSIETDQATNKSQWSDKLDGKLQVDQAVNAFKHAIDLNHGVREENLLRLLLPVGIRANQLDAGWIADMDTFGKQRGEVAHSSRNSHRARQQVNPADEFERVNLLLSGLRTVDTLLQGLDPTG